MSSVNVLKQADIFSELTPTQLELIASMVREARYGAGEVVFEENSSSDELYVIRQGEVEIQLDPGPGGDGVAREGPSVPPVTIATLRRGQSFGEAALVDRGLRSATARCAQNNTLVLVIPRSRLMTLCETYPQLGFRLMRNLAADLVFKIRSTDMRIREELFYGGQR